MVLVTFRFIGLAHLHTLWGCLAFVGFPSGFGLVCSGLCPLGFLLRCWLVFRWAVCTFGVVWAPWPPWSRLFPLGLCPRCSWRAFVVGCCGCCCGCPLALRCLFGGSSDQSSHITWAKAKVFCQSAIESAEKAR